jgi:hypothetical protein
LCLRRVTAAEKNRKQSKGESCLFHGGVLLEVRAFCAFIYTDTATTRLVRIC